MLRRARALVETRGLKPDALQRFAVMLDHATSLVHGSFFRRPTRKITIPLKCGTPKSRPLRSTSLQTAVTAYCSVVDPQRMMCTYGPAEGLLLNHSYMHGVRGTISTQYAVGVGVYVAGGRLLDAGSRTLHHRRLDGRRWAFHRALPVVRHPRSWESIVVTGTTFGEIEASSATVSAFVVVFLGSVAMWWLYFSRS